MILKCESCIESWIFPTFFDWLLFISGPRPLSFRSQNNCNMHLHVHVHVHVIHTSRWTQPWKLKKKIWRLYFIFIILQTWVVKFICNKNESYILPDDAFSTQTRVLHIMCCNTHLKSTNLFTSPKPKAQESISDHKLSVVRRRVNFSHFLLQPPLHADTAWNSIKSIHLLLQNQWANSKQTWHLAFFGKGDSTLFK